MTRVALGAVVLLVALLGIWAFVAQSPASYQATQPQETAKTKTRDEAVEIIREAMLEENPVRIELPNGRKIAEYQFRKLTEQEKAEALEDFEIRLRAKRLDLVSQDQETDAVKRELAIAMNNRKIAEYSACMRLVEEGAAIVTPGYIKQMGHNDDWYYYNVPLAEAKGILYVPIDLHRFGDVASLRLRYEEIKEFAKNDTAYRWNSLPYDERKAIVDNFNAIKAEVDAVRDEMRALRSKPAGELTTAEKARLDELNLMSSRMAAAAQRMIVKRVDPVTYEWSPN